MKNSKAFVAIVGIAFLIAIGAMTGSAANAVTAAPASASPVVGTQRLASTSTGDPLGPLTMLGISLTGAGVLLLLRRPVRHL